MPSGKGKRGVEGPSIAEIHSQHQPLRKHRTKVTFKQALDSPFIFRWPMLSEGDTSALVSQLTSFASTVIESSHKQGYVHKRADRVDKLPTDEKVSGKRKRSSDDAGARRCEKVHLNRWLAVGVNEVSKALEKSVRSARETAIHLLPAQTNEALPAQTNEALPASSAALRQGSLSAVVVLKHVSTPAIMHAHLPTLCALTKTPMCCIPASPDIMFASVGLQRVAALALKRVDGSSEQDGLFKSLEKAVLANCQPVSIPWLTERGVKPVYLPARVNQVEIRRTADTTSVRGRINKRQKV